ncbi:hypothetical protein [Corynebacterium sp. SA-MJD20WY100]
MALSEHVKETDGKGAFQTPPYGMSPTTARLSATPDEKFAR